MSGFDVAITAVAGRYSQADSTRELWEALVDGRELNVNAPDPVSDGHIPRVPSVANIDEFDHEFFGISPAEAELMDPQQRLMLTCAFEALENAGRASGDELRWGVFASASFSTYLLNNVLSARPQVVEDSNMLALIGNLPDSVATRLAYKLNLVGPAMTVQTACSSSLVALQVACRSLLDYECDGAIVAACSLTVPQARTRRHLQGSIFSHDGFCRPFDAAGTGTVKGNGCSVLTLRRLEDARDDHDPILAVIESVAVNDDGRDKVGYTAPSVLGEEEVIREALSLAEVEPSQIDYIEAHGTGTSLGDPIEFRALSRVFDHHVSALPVGSIKANIGHLDAAAGLTSVIKAVHMLDTGVVPPLINLEAVNPEIDNSSDTFSFPTRRTVGQLRHISVSSFGIGGTNAHAIIGSAPAGAAPRARCANTPVIASLSVLRPGDVDAREADLRQAAADLDTWDVAFTAVRNDRGMAYSRIIMLGEFPLVDVTREEILNQIADDGSLDLPLWTACLGCADPGASRQERTREAVELFLAVVLPTSHHKDPSVTSETVAQILDALPGPQDGWWSGPTTPSSRVALTGLLSLVMTCAEPARLSPLFAGTGARLVELPHLRLAVTKHWIGPADDGGDEPRSAAPIRQPASAPGSVLNEVLTAMREVLHVCVAPDDDFFLLGGDSLQAIDVLDRLHVNHPELTLATVLEARTPEGLARVLAHRDTQESGPVNLPSNFTVIRDDADRDDPPVFLIHPAGGTVFQYQVMNTHMHHPSRLVGVSLPANYRDFATLGELAGHYAEQIAAWWPQGPILLAGYSAGGNLAVEVAASL